MRALRMDSEGSLRSLERPHRITTFPAAPKVPLEPFSGPDALAVGDGFLPRYRSRTESTTSAAA